MRETYARAKAEFRMRPSDYVCTDPSHPPIYGHTERKSLFQLVSEQVVACARDGLSAEEVARRVSGDVVQRLTANLGHWSDGMRIQEIRRMVGHHWKDVFVKAEGLGCLVGWFINECAPEEDSPQLHHALCHLAFEANRNLFVITNQLRLALADDSFVLLRSLHETLVKSRFLKKHTRDDPDLPGRFMCHTNAVYKRFYERFAAIYGPNAAESMWAGTEEYFKSRVHPEAEGSYAWAFPLIMKRNGEPKKNPTFHDLRKDVDQDSTFSKVYYDVATEKTHGRFIWNPLMVRPDARKFRFDPFNGENTELVMDLMLPMFTEVIENTGSSCGTPEHAAVMSVVGALIRDIQRAVRETAASIAEPPRPP